VTSGTILTHSNRAADNMRSIIIRLMTKQQIKAIGFFLATYESNLKYISNFQLFKKKKNLPVYAVKGDHNFPDFLSAFRVARNVKKGGSKKLLKITNVWINNKANSKKVDEFAKEIKRRKLSHGKIMTSLASKILFLNDPWHVLPIDTQVRASVGQIDNKYERYPSIAFNTLKNKEFIKCLKFVSRFATKIEKGYKTDIKNIEKVRRNRLLDIFLWSQNGEVQELA